MDFHSKTEKERFEELAASIFADKIFGAGKYKILLPRQADSIDVLLDPYKVKIQVVRVGLGDNHFWKAAKNTEKVMKKDYAGWECIDGSPVSQICEAIALKIKKKYTDVANLILLMLCDMDFNSFLIIRNNIHYIQKVIKDSCASGIIFKEIWAVRRVHEEENLVMLWPIDGLPPVSQAR